MRFDWVLVGMVAIFISIAAAVVFFAPVIAKVIMAVYCAGSSMLVGDIYTQCMGRSFS